MTTRKAPEKPIELIRKIIERNRSVAVILETYVIEEGEKVIKYVIKKFVQADYCSLSPEGRWVVVSDSYTFPDLLKRFVLFYGPVNISHVQNQQWFRRNKSCNVLGVPANPPKGKVVDTLIKAADSYKSKGFGRADTGRELRVIFPQHLFSKVTDAHIQTAITTVYGAAPLTHPATSRVKTWSM
jgi:hypothetical protein